MARPHGGAGSPVSKHDAARDSLRSVLDGLALRSGDSRVALVTFAGATDPATNLASAAVVESGFTTPGAISDLLATFQEPVQTDPVNTLPTSPIALAIDEVLGLLQTQGDPLRGAVVLLASDVTPNIDGFGEGPLAYQEGEVTSIGLMDSFGDFLPAGEVAWLGNFNPQILTFDGRVLSDTMVAFELLRADQGDVRVISLIPRGTAANPPVLPEGLADFAAWLTQGAVVGADDPAALDAAAGSVLTAIDCDQAGPAQISGRVFLDLDGDGVFDVGEPGIGGVDILAGASSTVTAADGTYTVTVVAGTVTVAVDAADLGSANVPTGDPDGIGTPDTADITVAPWDVVAGADFGYAEPGGPLAGCIVDDFEDGVLAPFWDSAFLGNADQGSVTESAGTLKIEGDGTTAYAGTDNGVYVYQTVEGDFRVELDVEGFPQNTGGLYRKAGLMVRTGLGPLDARVMVQVVPDFAGTGPVLQFRARTTAGGPGDVAIASNTNGIGTPVRIAIERSGNLYTVQYSTDGGATWVTPAGGSQGSISVDLGAAPLVGTNVVSYSATTTLVVEVDDFQVCAPGATP
ncbi:MAG: hypothetical protein MI919_34210, partial [Holophagales bacterium]|nr:hypothetical protein [Holophagales bacterium]